MQFPLNAKHPSFKLMPLLNVEDAVVEMTFKRLVLMPPVKDEVAEPVLLKIPVTARFVVVAFVVVAFETERLVIVLVPLFARMPPESVASPDAESVVNDAAPAVRASAPMLMLPKFDVMEPESRMPTDVSDEPTTAEPKAVAERVLTPLMVSERPDARFNPPETERFVVVAFVVVLLTTERLVIVLVPLFANTPPESEVRPETLTVPVAMRLARVRLPEMRPDPCTERVAAGLVVPMPKLPILLKRAASLNAPPFKTENARAPVPVKKFWVRMLVSAAVVVAMPAKSFD